MKAAVKIVEFTVDAFDAKKTLSSSSFELLTVVSFFFFVRCTLVNTCSEMALQCDLSVSLLNIWNAGFT